MKRRRLKIPKMKPKDLWIAFFLLVLMAASVPSIDGPSAGAGSRLAGRLAESGSQMVSRVAHQVAQLY